MADYRKIVSIIKRKNKGYSWSMVNENPKVWSELQKCNIGSSDVPVFGVKNNNTSYGITWDEFLSFSKEFLYDANCDNFKNMPDSIYNVIFKKKRWDKIQGDKIKNQGIANVLSELHGLGLGTVGIALSKFGYIRPYSSGSMAENVNRAFTLTNEDVAFINKLEDEGKSSLLFDELKKEKDSVYWASKIYVLKTSEKIGIGVGVLFIGYVVYKIIKK
jgi:hypothetical protein